MKRIRYYKLAGKMVVECPFLEWAYWFETADRRVARDEVAGIEISTVFLGLDHNFFGKSDPLLFETLVFLPDGTTGKMRRYFTWVEAEQGHKEITDLIRAEAMNADLDAADIISQAMLKMN